MSRKIAIVAVWICLLAAAGVYAGMGYAMKCQAKPDEKTGGQACDYQTEVTFGGGMFFEQATGYCRACKKFVSLHWTRPDAIGHMPQDMQVVPQPKPLGEVWDSKTGEVGTVYACPHCKGPFMEIKKVEDLKYCPKCNQPHFGVDPNAPKMAID